MGFTLSLPQKDPSQGVVFEDTALEIAKEVAEKTQHFALAEAIDRERQTAQWLEGPTTDGRNSPQS